MWLPDKYFYRIDLKPLGVEPAIERGVTQRKQHLVRLAIFDY